MRFLCEWHQSLVVLEHRQAYRVIRNASVSSVVNTIYMFSISCWKTCCKIFVTHNWAI